MKWPPHGESRLDHKVIYLCGTSPADLPDDRDLLENALPPEPDEQELLREEAILSFARAIVAESGQLLVNDDPAIIDLVSLVAGEYVVVDDIEEGERPERGRSRPTVLILPSGEGTTDETFWLDRALAWREPERRTALERAVCMICIGRQERRDWEDFAATGSARRIYVLPETGAVRPEVREARLPDGHRHLDERRRLVEGSWREAYGTRDSRDASDEFLEVPGTIYPALAQAIIQELFDVESQPRPA